VARPALRDVPRLLWRTLDKFFADGCPGMAAALAFYTFFSLPALLALLLGTVGTLADPQDLRDAIIGQISNLIGPAGARQVDVIITAAQGSETKATIAAVLGGVAVLFGATTAFAQLQSALNRSWNVKPDPKRGPFRNFLAKRIFSFGVVLALGFLLLVSLSFTALLSAAGSRLTRGLGIPEEALAVSDAVLSFGAVVLLFAAMYKLLPDAIIAWRDVWVGAVATAVLFVGGKLLIGLYLGNSDPGSAYGVAGSLAIVMIWVYYSSMIVLFGAELTRVWADTYGRGVKPEKGAIEVIEQEKTVQAG
jgi:membrane protein